jgi:predicted MFS family arabinose efflux permease
VIPSLLRRRDFGRLWASGLVSMTGDWVTFTGLPLVVYDLTGSTLATGGMLLAGIVPRIAFGSLAGVFVDRWDRRRILIGANLAHAVFLLPLLAVHSESELWIVYAVAFVQATLGQLVEPAEGALLPNLVERDELVAANALNALNNNLARLIGPMVGGVTVQAAGLSGVVVVDAVSFLLAAALVAGVRADRGRVAVSAVAEAAGSAVAAFWRDWIDGLRLIARTRVAAVLVVFAAITGVGEGVIATLIVPFVTDVLESGGAGYGAILSGQAVGGLIGSVLIARWAGSASPAGLVVIGAVGLGVIDLVIFTYPLAFPILWPAIALMVVVGVPVAALRAGRATLEQTAVEDAYRGRLLGGIGTTMALAMAVGAVIGGTLGEAVGIVPLLVIQSVAYVVAGLGVGLLLRQAGGEAAPGS